MPSVGYRYLNCYLDSPLPEGLELESATVSYAGATLVRSSLTAQKDMVSLCLDNLPENAQDVKITLVFSPAYRIILEGYGAISMGENSEFLKDGSIVTVGWDTLNCGSFQAKDSQGNLIDPISVKESSHSLGTSYTLTYQINGSNLICVTTAP